MPRRRPTEERVYAVALGQLLRAKREKHGYSQKQLAERVGIAQNTLSRLERGVSLPDLLTYRLLAEELDTSREELEDLAHEAVLRAQRGFEAIHRVDSKAEKELWSTALKVVLFAGVVALIAVAVAAVLADEEPE